MFPAPRQRWVDAMASREADIRALRHETLIIHGRDDKVIPLSNSLTLLEWIDRSQLACLQPLRPLGADRTCAAFRAIARWLFRRNQVLNRTLEWHARFTSGVSGMKIDLTGKTAVVTGSTSGIGFAIAQGLAVAGARVILNGRADDRVRAAVSKLVDRAPERGRVGRHGGSRDRRGRREIPRRRSATPIFSSTISAFSNPSRSSKFPIPTGCGSSRPMC